MERVAEDDYRASAKSLNILGNTISASTVGRVLKDVGGQVHTELFGPQASLDAAKEAPSNIVSLMLIYSDGSRYRTNEGDKPRKERRAKPAGKLTANEIIDEVLSDTEKDRGWRENKIGVVVRALHGHYEPDGTYSAPKELVKTIIATVLDIQAFGHSFHTEAERRGINETLEPVWCGDHGHGNPGMLAREFSKLKVQLNIITDFYHCCERLSECAAIIRGEGSAIKQRQKLYRQLREKLWNGEMEKVISILREAAEAIVPRPETLSSLETHPAARQLWEHVQYFEKYCGTMDYPTYRAKGWPMGSGAVESACGQFGDRVKHNRMRWTRLGADCIHAIKAAILSQDDRWVRRWPCPIPILEIPVAA